MKKSLVIVPILTLSMATAFAQTPKSVNVNDIVDLEMLTHSELADKLHQGRTSVLVVAGGTEERGPHDVLGMHTILAHDRSLEIARRLGNTLVAPVMPIAVQATGYREGTDTPGAIQMPPEVFKNVMNAEVESMVMSGFKDIYVMGDHGGGQAQLKEIAEEQDAKLAPKGVHVYYIADFYQKTHDDIDMYMYEHHLPIGGHGAMMETSESLYLGEDARRARAADLQDGAVRPDRPDARAVESGARRAHGTAGRRRHRRARCGSGGCRPGWRTRAVRIRTRPRA